MPRPTDRPLGQKQLAGALSVVPNSATDVTTTHTWIFQIVCNNKTGGAVTFTVTDQASVPLDLLTAVSIPANSILVIDFPEGQYMPNGVKWLAGAAASLNAGIVGNYLMGVALFPNQGTSVSTTPVTVANLPANPVEGMRACVTNSNAASYTAGIGAVVAAGGTTHAPVFYDGTDWRIG